MTAVASTENLQAILLGGKREKMAKGEVLRSSEDSQTFYLVSSGYVKRYFIANDGRLDIQSIYGPGYFLPLITIFTSLFDQKIYEGPEVYYYEAMSTAELYSIDGARLAELVKDDPTLYRDLLVIAGRRLQANIQQIENYGLKISHKRVAHRLAFFAREFGKTDIKGTKILIPLTHQDLADILSVTRETVTQGIIKLRKEQLIKTGKYIIVPDIKKLEEEAYS